MINLAGNTIQKFSFTFYYDLWNDYANTVNHNLGSKNLLWVCKNSGGGYVDDRYHVFDVQEARGILIRFPNLNQAEIYFAKYAYGADNYTITFFRMV